MEKPPFDVKEKSIQAFFDKYHISPQSVDDFGGRRGEAEFNPYYFMKDEIILKKESGLAPESFISFELSDSSRYSAKKLINSYLYQVESYDDVAIKLVLVNLSIRLA